MTLMAPADEQDFFDEHRDLFRCPGCSGTLHRAGEAIECEACHHRFPITDGIPQLFWPNEWDPSRDDVTERMKAFYEESPFPNYDEFDSAATLLDKARRGLFAKLLDEQVPFGARVIECGCGTGQLTNFLAIANRTVFGVDFCVNSLRMAESFRRKNALDRAHFYQMNLFRPCFEPESFDLVISNGVLHHTSDPFLGFQSIGRLVRPGGYILIGLYHRYGRLATDLRRMIFSVSRDRFMFLDRHASDPNVSSEKRRSWFMDQYKNPHESKHTVGEVVRWLSKAGFEFVNSLPKTRPFSPIDASERLFKPDRLGSVFERFLVNLGMIIAGHREGGFFIVIAKKPAARQNSE